MIIARAVEVFIFCCDSHPSLESGFDKVIILLFLQNVAIGVSTT